MNTQKNKIIFLWDLHEVVFKKNLLHWVKLGLQFDQKIHLIKNFDRNAAKLIGSHLLEKVKISKKQISAQELIDFAKKQNNKSLVDFTIRLCCAYTPINETVTIIKQLQDLGYRHHIGSNIAYSVYEIFKHKHKDIFALFDETTVVQSAKNNGTIIKKPNPLFFTNHLEQHNLLPEQVIFIDDRKSNVEIAQSLGITGIQFSDPFELKRELMNRGFML